MGFPSEAFYTDSSLPSRIAIHVRYVHTFHLRTYARFNPFAEHAHIKYQAGTRPFIALPMPLMYDVIIRQQTLSGEAGRVG